MQKLSSLMEDLREAEAALDASWDALRTHGHQSITWKMLQADRARVNELHRRLDEGDYDSVENT